MSSSTAHNKHLRMDVFLNFVAKAKSKLIKRKTLKVSSIKCEAKLMTMYVSWI